MIYFFGDAIRGQRLAKIVERCGININMCIVTRVQEMTDIDPGTMPLLAILDDFPDSETARSAFYFLRRNPEVRFIALNDSPNAMKFLQVHALSFIMIISRDPGPTELVRAIAEMTASRCKITAPNRPRAGTDFPSDRSVSMDPRAIRCTACC